MKKSLYFIIPILCLLTVFNLYIYFNNAQVTSEINNNNELRSNVTQSEKLRNSILTMSDMGKYYLITGNTEYKTQYLIELNNSFDLLDKLTNSGVISNESSQNLLVNLNEYKNLYETLIPATVTSNSTKNVESTISTLANIESDMSSHLSETLVTNIETMDSRANTIIDATDIQSNISQIFSTILTLLMAIPMYFIKKLKENPTKTLEDVVETIKSENDIYKSNENTSDHTIKDNDCNIFHGSDELKEIENKLIERAVLLSYLKTLYSHNEYMKEQWSQASIMLNELDQKIDTLISQVRSIGEYSSLISNNDMETLKDKVNELQCLFEQLPNYHNFIMDLTKNIIVEQT